MRRFPVLLMTTVGVTVLLGACFQPVDVGSNLQQISDDADAGAPDAGAPDASFADASSADAGTVNDADAGGEPGRAEFWATDGSVPCGSACALEVGGDPTCTGDFTIRSDQEWQDLQQRGCTYLSGNLEITGTAMTTLTASGLQRISGSLTFRDSSLTSVSFPDLTTLGGNLSIDYFDRITIASFPSLTTTASLNIRGSVLATLELPALTEVRGHVTISTGEMTSFSLPALVTVRGAYMGIGGPSLTSLSLPALQTVMGNLGVGGAALATVDMPVLRRAGNLYVRDTALSDLGVPSLATVMDGQLHVSRNPQLRQCLVDALRLRLTPAPTDFVATENLGTPNICP